MQPAFFQTEKAYLLYTVSNDNSLHEVNRMVAEVAVVMDAVLKFIHYKNTQIAFGTCNTVLVKSHGKTIIVDPGHLSFRNILKTRLAEANVQPTSVDAVINTHLHFDHFAGNPLFRGSRLYVHQKELEYMKTNYWPEMTAAFIDVLDPRVISEGVGEVKIMGDVSIIETPGHTVGSLSVLIRTREGLVVVAGDAVSTRTNYMEKTAPLYSLDREQAVKSIEKIAGLKPAKIVPGHDKPFSCEPPRD